MQLRRMLVQICSDFYFYFFYFKLEGYWFKSSEHSKSLNSVNTNKKILHLIYFFSQKFSSTEIVPPHSPSTTLHMRTFNAATQKKGLHSQSLPVFVSLSLLISLWCTPSHKKQPFYCAISKQFENSLHLPQTNTDKSLHQS